MTTKAGRLDRLAIAQALREMSSLLGLAGGEPFKARAYERGARVLERADVDLGRLIAEGRLTALQGIGPGLARIIAELHLTGRSPALENLRQRFPPGASELGRVPGLGIKQIAALHAQLGIETMAELEAACEAGQVRTVKGFGEARERRLLRAMQKLRAPARTKVLLPAALDVAEQVRQYLRRAPGVHAVEVAGDLRRWTETVDDLVVVLGSTQPRAALEHVLALPLVAAVSGQDQAGCRLVLTSGLPLEVKVVAPSLFATELFHATGAVAHVERVQGRAHDRGLRLEASGLSRARGGRRVPIDSEAEIYRQLGLQYVPPELRQDEGEIEAAQAGSLPHLIEPDEIRGFVHCHTDYSDGRHTVEQMARAAESLGLQYLTITDHSPEASYAGGLSIDRLKAQWDEIARVQETATVRLLRGTESDILADGSLDYPDAILEQLDIVIASIHRRHRMDAEQMTRRIARAMEHPCFKIWGHALGRLIESRPPVDCHMEEILEVIARSRAAIEINGDPHRLDMEPRWVRAARRRGIRFVISTDAHAVSELDNLRYGVAMARRGGVPAGEVLNTLDADAFTRAVSPITRSRVQSTG
jgi:DNA polymerase (family X)